MALMKLVAHLEMYQQYFCVSMIQVLDPKPHKSVVKEVICCNCGVTLSYTPNDVQKRVIVDYGGGRDTIRFINCPPCGNELVLSY